jgi:hypothetical protein
MNKIQRVSKGRPCFVCGRIDFCGYTVNKAFCMRVQQGSYKTARNGAYVHRLSGIKIDNINLAQPAVPVEAPRALLARRDEVYRALLDGLVLQERDGADLDRRGFSAQAIIQNGYKSTVAERQGREFAMKLSRSFDLTHVPGFYLEAKSWRMAWMPEGFFIPVRGDEGKIQALSVRRMDGAEKNKYVWFSSGPDRDGRLRKGGASSGAPVHVVNASRIADEVLLTEGILKADAIAHLSGLPVFGAAGTNFNPPDGCFATNLRRAYPNLLRTVICFDADALTNEHVYKALLRLARSLERERFEVRVRTWASDLGKGFDDYLLSIRKSGRACLEVAA